MAIDELTQEQELELLLLEREIRRRQGKALNQDEEASLASQVFEALKRPEELSREGLKMIADSTPSLDPTGNLTIDLLANVPKITMETLAEVAPSFISRGAILTAGALRGGKAIAPAIKTIGKGIAGQAEQLSGLGFKTPGVLSQAAKDPTLILGKGTQKAGQAFRKILDKGQIRSELGRSLDKKDLVREALKFADEGTLTAEEALLARRTLDQIRKTVPESTFTDVRNVFDKIAKTKTAKADVDFSRAVKSEALRNIFPQNKLGGASAFKLGIGAGLGGGLGFINPALATLSAGSLSPAAQGIIATALGLGAKGGSMLARTPIQSGSAISGLLRAIGSQNSQR